MDRFVAIRRMRSGILGFSCLSLTRTVTGLDSRHRYGLRTFLSRGEKGRAGADRCLSISGVRYSRWFASAVMGNCWKKEL